MGAVNTTYTFTATDTITSTKMNNIIDQTTMTDEAISGSTLEVTSSGRLKVRAFGITSNEMASNSVVSAAIVDSSVTTSKILDLNVTTGKIADLAVTNEKIANSTIEKSKLAQGLRLSSVQTPISVAFVDFTSIPSWVTRVTILFDKISLSAGADILVQLGDAGGLETTNYASASSGGSASVSTSSSTSGFIVLSGSSACVQSGSMVIANITGNTWVSSHSTSRTDTSAFRSGGGTKTLSDVLTQIRITTTSTDNFDAGSINIMLE